jgi:hypothetical protein
VCLKVPALSVREFLDVYILLFFNNTNNNPSAGAEAVAGAEAAVKEANAGLPWVNSSP